MLNRLIFILITGILSAGCDSTNRSNTGTQPSPQAVVTSISDIDSYSAADLAKMKTQIVFNGKTAEQLVPTVCGMRTYKIAYNTKDINGQATVASGLLAIPVGKANGAIVSYQHGTSAHREEVPSRGTKYKEGAITTALYAGGCYVVVEADYLGLGDNPGFHPYLHAETEASASADLIKAVIPQLANYGITWNNKLFLAGYSQGGHSTMALHRHLEQTGELQVTASAPMAGPYDLSKTSMQTCLEKPSSRTTGYAAYIIFSFHHTYGAPANYSEAIQPPLDTIIDKSFDGTHTGSEAAGVYPLDPKEFITFEYQQDIINQNDTPFIRALRQNDLYQWVPQAPVRLYHGTSDVDVPFGNSQLAYNYMHARGSQIDLINLGPLDHINGFTPAILASYRWFNTLK